MDLREMKQGFQIYSEKMSKIIDKFSMDKDDELYQMCPRCYEYLTNVIEIAGVWVCQNLWKNKFLELYSTFRKGK